ncbi:MAG: hypothetical protein HY434_00805 [Candidatus Liptonbacteria bacterium]|nr:hypothetical protein [Candidatus Liptonbacteria bacterium]
MKLWPRRESNERIYGGVLERYGRAIGEKPLESWDWILATPGGGALTALFAIQNFQTHPTQGGS